MLEIKGKYTDAKIFIDDVEEGVFEQIYGIINSQVSDGLKVRIMPDTHVGSGICIGLAMELGKFLNANWCGVDISCGLLSAKFDKNTHIDLEKLELQIRQTIPTGFNIHDSSVVKELDFNAIQNTADKFVSKYNERFGTSYSAPTYNQKWLSNRLKEIKMDEVKFWNSISSMGGSNHFLELGRSLSGDYWITVHSGSRNLGVKVADYWNNVANGKVKVVSNEYNKELDYILVNTMPKSDIPKKLKELKEKYTVGIDKGYLSGDNMMGYLYDMILCYHYAQLSRYTMLELIRVKLGIKKYDDFISTVHNYIDMDDMIIRKGAVKAIKGQRFLLPFNMRDGILICEGLSNPDWLCTSPHGSGRLFSRSKAKETVDFDEYKKSMKGIVTTSVTKSTLDESPQSYKNSELIESLIQDTAVVIDRIKPILNIKDCGKSESWKERKAAKKERDRKREMDRDAVRKMKRRG